MILRREREWACRLCQESLKDIYDWNKFSTKVWMNLEAISECGQKVAVRNRGRVLMNAD